jgi:hypothetical protein
MTKRYDSAERDILDQESIQARPVSQLFTNKMHKEDFTMDKQNRDLIEIDSMINEDNQRITPMMATNY